MTQKTIFKLFNLLIWMLFIFSFSYVEVSYTQWKKSSLKGKIQLELEPYKRKFLRGENIWGEVKIKNVTNHFISVPQPTSMGALELRVKDIYGNFLRYRGFIIERGGYEVDTLKAHEIRIENVLISAYYGNDTTSFQPFLEFLPGRYQAFVTLEDVSSNSIEFEVVQPSPSEEIVRKRLKSEVIYFKNPGKQFEKTILNAKQLISQYPTSAYLPRIYEFLLSKLRWIDDPFKKSSEITSIAMSFIDKFPNSPETEAVINDYFFGLTVRYKDVDKMTDKKEIEEKIVTSLSEIRGRYPSMRVARYVDKKIMQLTRKETIEKDLR
jgi:hypothetical protein